MSKLIQDKVLFYGGSLLIGLGIFAVILFSFGSNLDITPHELITPLIVIVFGCAIIMIIMGFVEMLTG